MRQNGLMEIDFFLVTVNIFGVWPLIRFPILAKYFLCMLQTLLLSLCNLVRMNLLTLGNLNNSLVSFQGFQNYFCLEYRRKIPSCVFASK
jgi:hypothetical protein